MKNKKKKRDQDSHHSSEGTVPGCHVAQLCRLQPGWTVKGCSEASQAGLQASEIHHTRCWALEEPPWLRGLEAYLHIRAPVFFSTYRSWSLCCPPRAQKHCRNPKLSFLLDAGRPHEQQRDLTARFPLWSSDPPPNSERGSAAAPPRCLSLHLPNAMAVYLPPQPPSLSSIPSDVFLP